MVMVMAMTSLYMVHHGHGLGDVSIVIMAHTLGMYGLSMLTGRLADNLGRPPTIMAGALLLAAGCLLAPLSQLTGVLAVALFLLGLGWNFCYVAGGALLTDTPQPCRERGRVQGSNDLAVGFISAFGSLQSGVLFAWLGFANLGWLSVAVAMLPLLLTMQFLARQAGALTSSRPIEAVALSGLMLDCLAGPRDGRAQLAVNPDLTGLLAQTEAVMNGHGVANQVSRPGACRRGPGHGLHRAGGAR